MSRKLAVHELKNFHPFHLVDDDQLWMMACSVVIKSVNSGQTIFNIGDEDDTEFYLLSGEVDLLAADGVIKSVKAGELVAKHPIARLRPRRYTAVSRKPSVLFSMHRDVLAALHAGGIDAQKSNSIYQVDEIPFIGSLRNNEPAINQTILAAIIHDLKINSFVLPDYPGVADLVLEEIQQDNTTSVAKIANIAYKDPAIATKILKAANSSIYRNVERCETVLNSIARLGPNTTKQLMHCYVTRDEFRSTNHYLNNTLFNAWKECVRVSAIVGIMSKVIPEFEEATGRLAGLVHRVGTIALLHYIDKYSQYFRESFRVDELFNSLAGPIGEIVLRHYGFNESCADVAAQSGDWFREGTDEPDYCDLVIVARLHNKIATGQSKDLPKMNTLPAFQKLARRKLTAEFMIKVMALVNKQTFWLEQIDIVDHAI